MHFMAHIDKQNRLTIPFEIRSMYALDNDDSAYFECQTDGVIVSFSNSNPLKLKYCKIDPKGRIVLPDIYCKFFDLKEGTYVHITILGNKKLLLYPSAKNCIFCGNEVEEFFVYYKGKKICPSCKSQLKELL